MLLDALRDFTWYNEPHNVRFIEEGMIVEVAEQTDFWQSAAHNFHRDNGHFLYTEKTGDFTLTLKWHSDEPLAFAQCGVMVRLDNLNWAKGGVLSPDLYKPQLGTVVTNAGHSDWAVSPLYDYNADFWYRLRRKNGDFIIFYSVDGQNFQQIRLFRFWKAAETVKVGAYACSPQRAGFRCILENIEFS